MTGEQKVQKQPGAQYRDLDVINNEVWDLKGNE